jgi:hypothetical protein
MLYMMMPQPTEQYGHVLRVSVARASLKLRASANAGAGEKPSAARVEAARPVPVTWKNCRRFISIEISCGNAAAYWTNNQTKNQDSTSDEKPV